MTISLHIQTSAPNTAAVTSVSSLEQSGSSKTKFSRTKIDIYQTVTDNIVSALEAGVKPWSCPWQRVPGMSGLPTNYATGAAYSGMNIMLLWSSASEQGFSDSRWMTYKQAQAEGGQVRKGEHGTTAIFYTTLEKENDDGETNFIPMLKTFTVFSVEQIDGLPLSDEAVCPAETFEPYRVQKRFYVTVVQPSLRRDKTPFLHRQPMKSVYRNVVFLPMLPISTPPACMS